MINIARYAPDSATPSTGYIHPMFVSDFDFDLPEDLIAVRPVTPRRASRLLVRDGDDMTLGTMADLPTYLQRGDLLVFNNTRVIPALLKGIRRRGDVEANVEVTLISQTGPATWRTLAKPARKLQTADRIRFAGDLEAEVISRNGGEASLAFNCDGPTFRACLDTAGTMPLPPYIASRRAPDTEDRDRYQTVFARHDGAVAAPTASLHFDEVLMSDLEASGIGHVFVTLHVGAGTFLPVKTDRIADHVMHAEWGEVTSQASATIAKAKADGRRIIAVGTTALRLLESAASDGKMAPFEGETDIFITPGYKFRITDGLITNFHLPKSTLMMLVSALMGTETMRDVYAHAIANRLRFYSYGDASLLLPQTPGQSLTE